MAEQLKSPKEDSLILDSAEAIIERSEGLFDEYEQEIYRVLNLADMHPEVDYETECDNPVLYSEERIEEELQKKRASIGEISEELEECLQQAEDLLLEYGQYRNNNPEKESLRGRNFDTKYEFWELEELYQELEEALQEADEPKRSPPV